MKIRINNYLLIILLIFFNSFLTVSQTNIPIWIDSNFRNMQYPKEDYYSGFAEITVKQGEEQEKTINRAKQVAVGELSEQIRMIVNSNKTSIDMSIGGSDIEERIRSTFSSIVNTSSQTDIIGCKVDTYYDIKNKIAYAFTYANKPELADFYKKQINMDLDKVEISISISEQLVMAGKKLSAYHKIKEAKQILLGIDIYRNLLVAVNSESDEIGLQIERGRKLSHLTEQLLINLEQSTFIYVNCYHEYKDYEKDNFNNTSHILYGIIAQALSENECNVTDNKEEADYELNLITSTTLRSDGKEKYGILSYYANVKGTLYNRLTKKKTVEFTIFNDPDTYATGRSHEDAATKAFRLPKLKDKMLEKILPKITE